MTDYLHHKWHYLRMFRTRNSLLIDYRILRNTAKLMGVK